MKNSSGHLLLNNWEKQLNKIISLPQAYQLNALTQLRKKFVIKIKEEWNTDFEENSLYEAWTTIDPMVELYEANRNIIKKFLNEKKNWNIVEIGGGNGALWKNFFNHTSNLNGGTFTLIDPVISSHEVLKKTLPGKIVFHSIIKPVEHTDIPEADILICSLMLHHIPGFTSTDNKKVGIICPGKTEIIKKYLNSIRKCNGICIINESDIYTDIHLPSNDPVLIHRLIDSYIRRAAKAVSKKINDPDIDISMKQRLEFILIHWLIDQVETASTAPLDKRDVYELDTIHWLELLKKADADIISHQFTDDWHLFHQYVIK